MAVLQKIRNRAGIFVIIFVGVALFLFIVDPTTFQGLFVKNDTSVAKIDGEKIDYKEFQELYDEHREFMLVAQRKTNLEAEEDESVREQAWNDILQRYLMEPHYEDVGLFVGEEEVEDLLYGSNIHYVISQNFTNPQTGQLDTASIRNFFDRAAEDPAYVVIAEYWKNIIRKDRLNTKYNNMVAKGFYSPIALAKMDYMEKNEMYDFEIIFRAYKDIADEEIKISDSDIKTYYDNHQYMFLQNEKSRDIEYVVFSIIPSDEDSLMVFDEIKELYVEFLELEEGHLDYANRYSEHKTRSVFISQADMTAGLDEEFFTQPVGTTSEIILDNNLFYFSRIIDIAERPDSAMASHILIAPSEQRSLDTCRIIADSLMQLIEAGEDFAIIALMNSEDPGSKDQGGDLGWFTDGMMVDNFNEACFAGKVGDLTIVETQFGMHIIKVKDQTVPKRKVKLATVNKEIHFSDRTSNFYFSKASSFASSSNTSKKFDETIVADKLVKRIAGDVKELDNKLSGIENAREIVRWVYDENSQKGDISTVFTYPDKFIVVKLAEIKEKGVTPFDAVKDRIEPIILKDKKAEKLIAELNKELSGKSDLFAVAQKFNLKIDTATNVSFSSFSIPGYGMEPKINASLSGIELNKLSKPIKGNNGVYVVRLINITKAPEKSEFVSDQLGIMRNNASQVYKIFDAMEKKSNIEDFRARYF